jgi:uncharacterized protein (DUF4415 family)
MSKVRKSAVGTLKSLDGKRTVTIAEFERLFDEGSDKIDDFIDWSSAETQPPPVKTPVTLRMDSDVLEWFKSFGPGYQTRINAVLRTYKKARQKPA